jgi:hypothetical protein
MISKNFMEATAWRGDVDPQNDLDEGSKQIINQL